MLAVDPSSTRTGGSVLGDKTRMARLAGDPDAYIRPSPTAGTLGGVARATRQAIVVLEAAGYDVCWSRPSGSASPRWRSPAWSTRSCSSPWRAPATSCRASRRACSSWPTSIVVNKADGEHAVEAKTAARELSGAIRLIYPRETLWRPPVLTMSAVQRIGLTELWETVLKHRQVLTDAGEFEARRRSQQVDWTWSMVRDTVLDRVLSHPAVRKIRAEVERRVRDGELTPVLAAQQILDAAEEP